MPTTIPLGSRAKAYLSTTTPRAAWAANASSGIYVASAPAGLSEFNAVKDVKITAQAGEADTSTRAGAPFELAVASLINASVEFSLPWQPTDSNFSALLSAFWGQTTVAMAILDGSSTTSGSRGLWADFTVLECSQSQELKNAQMATVKIKPTNSAVPPQYVQVT